MLIHLLQELVDDGMHGTSREDNNNNNNNYMYDAQGVESGDPMVQYLGVLLHTIIAATAPCAAIVPAPPTTTNSNNKGGVMRRSNNNSNNMNHISGFVAGGGVRWAAKSLVELTARLCCCAARRG